MVKKIDAHEWNLTEEDESGDSGHSGGSGVEFRFDISPGERRDDLLSSKEKHLLKIHHDLHYDLVKKQKIERKNRNEIKEGKRPAVANNYSVGNSGYGMNQGGKPHPLSQKAYFSGIDKQVIGLQSENLANTNEGEKEELKAREELKLQNRFQHKNVPKFNPTPRPGG